MIDQVEQEPVDSGVLRGKSGKIDANLHRLFERARQYKTESEDVAPELAMVDR